MPDRPVFIAAMNSAPQPFLSGIGQIAVTVADVSAATVFYRDVLGLRFLFPPARTSRFSTLAACA